MLNKMLAGLVLLSLTGVASAIEEGDTEVQWAHAPGKRLSLSIGGQTLWTYHFGADEGFSWFHPLKTADGVELTDFAPADHPWHRALWFSWKHIEGVNFWDWGGRPSGQPAGLTQRVGKEVVRAGKESCSIDLDVRYVAEGRTLMTEHRTIRIGLPRPDGSYTLDWQMTFTANERDVVLGRTDPAQASWGGYAGLSFRAAASLRDYYAVDSEGRRDKAGHGKRARWMDFGGTVAEKDVAEKDVAEKGTVAGVAFFDHPANPRHPSPWYVSLGGMPYFSPAFLFDEPYTLAAGKPLVLRYRVLIHAGRPQPAELEKEYERFRAAYSVGDDSS